MLHHTRGLIDSINIREPQVRFHTDTYEFSAYHGFSEARQRFRPCGLLVYS